jgi:hypothetical protein
MQNPSSTESDSDAASNILPTKKKSKTSSSKRSRRSSSSFKTKGNDQLPDSRLNSNSSIWNRIRSFSESPHLSSDLPAISQLSSTNKFSQKSKYSLQSQRSNRSLSTKQRECNQWLKGLLRKAESNSSGTASDLSLKTPDRSNLSSTAYHYITETSWKKMSQMSIRKRMNQKHQDLFTESQTVPTRNLPNVTSKVFTNWQPFALDRPNIGGVRSAPATLLFESNRPRLSTVTSLPFSALTVTIPEWKGAQTMTPPVDRRDQKELSWQ